MTKEEAKETIRDAFENNSEYADEIIKALEQELRWIPVSEELPKEFICEDGYVEPSDYVLVWGDHGNYGVSRYWGHRRSKSESPNTCKDWMDLDWVIQKPMAWQPLPNIKGGFIQTRNCDQGVLDKIRAEIEALEEGITSYHNDRPWIFKDETLLIIDKYRAELQEKN